jgi:hypothetical protein
MAKKLLAPPRWITRPLQGITFWIGHRRSLYSGYPLPEAALVAELCNIIFTHKESDQVLKCEVQYASLLSREVEPNDYMTAKARADIVIYRKAARKKAEPQPEVVIEVKRSKASAKQINNDLLRLAEVKRQHPNIKAYLIVVSESHRPARFVDSNGFAITRTYRIPTTNQLYRVRRVAKAASAFTKKDTAQYACLIEVSMPKPPAKLRGYRTWASK